MFPQLGTTAESLSKASSLVFRIGTDAHLYDDPDDVNIAPLLDSSFDSEKAEALKRLLALISQGEDVSNFFPQVVKNVASQSLEVKKLVYLYLLHYAEKRPNEALLSINCFQKDLSDHNPLVRAWALRAMSGIRLHVISPIVLVALSKCAKDPSSYVRKCAAYALPKLNDLHQEENAHALEELVSILLNDLSPCVVGAAATALNSVCPDNLPLIGRSFKRLCQTLPDIDEWGQIALIDLLLRYVVARHGLVKESLLYSSCVLPENGAVCIEAELSEPKLGASMFRDYIQGSEEYLLKLKRVGEEDGATGVLTSMENNDLKLLLQCTSPLLWSQNSSVVLAAARVHWILASEVDVNKIVKPLLFVLRSSYASRYVILRNVQVFAKAMPVLFVPYYEDFVVSSSDPYQMRALKLEILSTIASETSIPFILQELQDYIKDPDRRFAVDAVAAIALCAQKVPSVAKTCLDGLLALIYQESSFSRALLEGETAVLVQAIMSVKAIIKHSPAKHEKVVIHLVRCLDKINESSSRALIIWILGEYAYVGQLMPKILPLVLGHLAHSFTSEEPEAKHQILNTSTKVVLNAVGEELQYFIKVLGYILEMAKFDSSYDVRDRARAIEKLLMSRMAMNQEKEMLHVEVNDELLDELLKHMFCKRIASMPYSISNFRLFLPGSLSHIVLHAAPGYTPLPKPGTLSEMALDKNMLQDGAIGTNSECVTKPFTLSDSSVDGNHSDYGSEVSFDSLVHSENPESMSGSEYNERGAFQATSGTMDYSADSELVHLTDASVVDREIMTFEDEDANVTSLTSDFANLMSKTSLETWLNEQPGLPSMNLSTEVSGEGSSARVSINDIGITVKPKTRALLDTASENGLKVVYSFPSKISDISPLLMCVELVFENASSEALKNIAIKDEEPNENAEFVSQAFGTQNSVLDPVNVPTIVPMEEIASLDPGNIARRILQVYFHHHLLPRKLAIFCNEKRHPVKLQPDVGYFIRPLTVDMDTFTKKENQLCGMFEYSRRCTFKDHIDLVGYKDSDLLKDDRTLLICRKVASKMLSNANFYLVSVDMPVCLKFDEVSDLCLRFSSEILSSSKPCLVTLMVEGKCSEPLEISVKVNCEETVFGLNLLNRIVAFLGSNITSE